jgi:sugar lactone lactonase YvrE
MADILLTGLAFGESPRWHDGRLWVSDWGAQEILAVDTAGNAEVAVKVGFPAFPMCIDWLPGDSASASGRGSSLLVVNSTAGLLLRRMPGGELATYADMSGIREHSWNDIVVDGRGNVYVNSAGIRSADGQFSPGIVVLVTPDGTVRQVADDLAFANGMAVTPDNQRLIVAESHGNALTAFDIAADGSLSGRHTWADLGGDHPDGICIDAEGAVWYADVASQHCVRVAEGGRVLQTVTVDRGCFACVLGGEDRRTLFIVAQEWHGFENANDGSRTGQVLTASAPAPGSGWP